MTINDISNRIIGSIDPSWSKLEKIRYVYLALGKVLHKHTDFFFSIDNKLDYKNLSYEEIEKAYENKCGTEDFQVICRSAAFLLENIFDRLGIKSKLVKSNNNVVEYTSGDNSITINHWFLVAYDEENNPYFMTLASDLPFIQMGLQTKHFGTYIPYKKQVNGEEIQVYAGPEIKPRVLSEEELYAIDGKIGYLINKDFDDKEVYANSFLNILFQKLKSNNLYYDIESGRTDFYRRSTVFKSNDKTISFYDDDLHSLSKEDWVNFLRIVCRYVHRRIESIIGYKIFVKTYYTSKDWNYDEWIKDISAQIQRYLWKFVPKDDDSLYVGNNFKYSSWSKKMKKAMGTNYDVIHYYDILSILDKTNVIANMALRTGIDKNFSKVYYNLCYHFIPKNRIYENSLVNGVVSSRYIFNKFKLLFRNIFVYGIGTEEFKNMRYGEQITIIKMVIDKMFPELNMSNALLSDEYNPKYSLAQHRILIYALRSKDDYNYAMVFYIPGDSTIADQYYFYEPKTNLFKTANMLEIQSKYIIVSDRFKSKIQEMENIDKKRNMSK